MINKIEPKDSYGKIYYRTVKNARRQLIYSPIPVIRLYKKMRIEYRN